MVERFLHAGVKKRGKGCYGEVFLGGLGKKSSQCVARQDWWPANCGRRRSSFGEAIDTTCKIAR